MTAVVDVGILKHRWIASFSLPRYRNGLRSFIVFDLSDNVIHGTYLREDVLYIVLYNCLRLFQRVRCSLTITLSSNRRSLNHLFRNRIFEFLLFDLVEVQASGSVCLFLIFDEKLGHNIWQLPNVDDTKGWCWDQVLAVLGKAHARRDFSTLSLA